MQKKLSTLALVVLVAIIAFACGTMVTDVEAQASNRTYIGTYVYPSLVNGQPNRYYAYAVYEENGQIKQYHLNP